jgi:hypothetical protein
VTVDVLLPKYVQAKRLKGVTAFYWTPPTKYRKIARELELPFFFENIFLGSDLGSHTLASAARTYNEQFDEWRKNRQTPPAARILGKYGTMTWLVEVYLRSEKFEDRVGEVTRPDYRRVLEKICALTTEKRAHCRRSRRAKHHPAGV